MLRIKHLFALLAISAMSMANAQDHYLLGLEDFENISSHRDRAQAFAVCTAVFAVARDRLDPESKDEVRYINLINSSKKAIAMSMIEPFSSTEISIYKFEAAWEEAQQATEAWPKENARAILNESRLSGSFGQSDWLLKVQSTMDVCVANSKNRTALSSRLDSLLAGPLFSTIDNK